MFRYKIIGRPKDFKINKRIVDSIFSIVSENITDVQKGTLNIVFLPDQEIQRLNKEYRGIDSTTDVLSFHYFDDFSGLLQKEIAGEIILSESKIRIQSAEFGNSLEEEFYKLLIHSILHILGFDHEEDDDYKEMGVEENRVIGKINKEYNIIIS